MHKSFIQNNQKVEKQHNQLKFDCILKYATIEVALTVLAKMNGLELDGKPIQINFSKQKL